MSVWYVSLASGKAPHEKGHSTEQGEQSPSALFRTWRWGHRTPRKILVLHKHCTKSICGCMTALLVPSCSNGDRFWVGSLLGEGNVSCCIRVLLQTRESCLASVWIISAAKYYVSRSCNITNAMRCQSSIYFIPCVFYFTKNYETTFRNNTATHEQHR